MGKIIKLIISVVVCCVVMLIIEPYDMATAIGSIGIALIFCICWDFLEILEFSKILTVLKQIIFYGSSLIAIFLSFAAVYGNMFGEYAIYMQAEPMQKVAFCGALPATIATLILCTIADIYDESRNTGPVLVVGGVLTGGIVGYILSLTSSTSCNFTFTLIILVSLAGLVYLVHLIRKYGFVFMTDGPVRPISSSSSSGYSTPSRSSSSSSYNSSSNYNTSSYNSSSSGYGEGYRQYEYYMSDIAYKYSKSRNCAYGVSIRSSVSQSLYGVEAVFTVDFEIDTTCCSATTQSELNVALRDIENFQREVMQDIYKEATSLNDRIYSQYQDFEGVNIEVRPGNVSQY